MQKQRATGTISSMVVYAVVHERLVKCGTGEVKFTRPQKYGSAAAEVSSLKRRAPKTRIYVERGVS